MMGSSLCLLICMRFVCSFILFNFTNATNFINASSMLLPPLCHDDDRSALLRFKESLIIIESHIYDDIRIPCRPKVASWKHKEEGNGIDCCLWDGVHCNQNTGRVIKLDLSNSCLFGSINSSSSLFNLSHLQWLNLALNDFNFSKIPPEIINLSRLSYLDLSSSFFSGQIPSEILELTNLVSLHLSQSPFYLSGNSSLVYLSGNSVVQLQKPSLRNLAEKLTNLKELDLSGVTIASPIPLNFANLSSLTFLSLSGCELRGRIPSSLGNLTGLIYLYLSENDLLGQLPNSIGNLTRLIYLDLSMNELLGQLPTSIENLSSLKQIHLVFNRFSGELPDSIGKLRSLEELNIRFCNFAGQIGPSLGNMTQLKWLDLGSNKFLGELPAFIGNLRSLQGLDISYCNFSGQIPPSLGNLTQLNYLALSMNHFNGMMELDIFLINLKNLHTLSLSSNKLSLITKSTFNTTSKKFSLVALGSCSLTEFPNFLKNQKHLNALDLSSNKIHGKVPRWLLDASMQNFNYLNLSHNFLTGFDQHPVVLPWSNTYTFTLDLSSNSLQGLLPVPPANTENYLVSNNMLTGEIPWICNLKVLFALDLSNNNLSGKLPTCLGNFSDYLSLLDLHGNNFFGTLPDTFMNGSSLRMMDLSENLLQGRIPPSLANCTRLEFLNLGNNQINDTFPVWLGTLLELNVLILRSNNFHGEVSEPNSECGFPKLRIIDLSNNKFTGKLPSKYFQCWNAMKFVNRSQLRYMEDSLNSYFNLLYGGNTASYDYSLTISNKGQMLPYDKIPDILTGIILSSNKFDGEIPTSIANLKDLQVLSLANNNLQGHIPSSLRNLTELESLDLSSNRFSGQIPQQLVELTFLGFFNVSHNNLTGSIPQGNQFSTFDNTSFDGNSGLCGKPLSKECQNSERTTNEDDVEGSESLFAFDWKIILIGYVGGLIAGVALGVSFSTGLVEWILEKFERRSTRMRRNRRR